MAKTPTSRLLARRTLIFGGATVLVGGFLYQRYARPAWAGQALDPVQAHEKALSGEISLVDIRTPREWAKTGVGEGASPLDMRRDDFVTELDALLGGDRSKPVALICARGVRSARLSNRLAEAGFTNIIDVPEGMLGSTAGPGWLRRGLNVVEN